MACAGDDTPGARCTNTPFLETFTCPACYHDHPGRSVPHDKPFDCAGCGVMIVCTVEDQPVYVATIYEIQADMDG